MILQGETDIDWWMGALDFIAAIAQPLIVIALSGLIGVWISFGKKLTEATANSNKALDLGVRTGELVSELSSSVNRLNDILHSLDIHNTKMEGRVVDIEQEIGNLRVHKHSISNIVQVHETKIALLEQRKNDA